MSPETEETLRFQLKLPGPGSQPNPVRATRSDRLSVWGIFSARADRILAPGHRRPRDPLRCAVTFDASNAVLVEAAEPGIATPAEKRPHACDSNRTGPKRALDGRCWSCLSRA